MPQIRIRDSGGTLRTISRIRLRDAGNVLRTITRVRMRDASNVLRDVSALEPAAVVPAGSYGDSQPAPGPVTCFITFHADGTWSAPGTGGTWLTGDGTGANYWIDWDTTSGSLTSGSTTIQSLSSDRTYSVSFSGAFPGNKTCTGTVEIFSDAGGTNLLDSGSITITASVDP